MIDIESQVYDPIAKAIRTAYPETSVSGEYVRAPSSFPHVSIVEEDNYTSTDKLDTADQEKYSTVMYEVNIYSNRNPGKKAECKTLLSFISALFYNRNFTRLSASPVPNLENATIYRITARYRAETDGENLYRR